MRGAIVLCLALATLGFALAACGGTSTDGGGEAGTAGQETSDQPELEGGDLRTPAYTSGHQACGLLPVEELARQNNTKPTKEAVARKVGAFETTEKARQQSYQGCLDALNGK
jgi:hypothetical protein